MALLWLPAASQCENRGKKLVGVFSKLKFIFKNG